MSSIKVVENNLTPLMDFDKTFGKLLFIEQISDREAQGENGERGEITAVRFEVLSIEQGTEFRVQIKLDKNPMAESSLANLQMDDEIELVEPQVFERNINNGSTPNLIVTIEALDVRKKGAKVVPPKSSDELNNKK